METSHRKSSYSLKGFQSKKTPCSIRLTVKLYTLFKTQDLENHSLFSGTYSYRPNKGVPPPRGREVNGTKDSIPLEYSVIKDIVRPLLGLKSRNGKIEQIGLNIKEVQQTLAI